MIFCLNRPQLNIHSFWCGLFGSFFGMCVKETKGCAFDYTSLGFFKEIRHHYIELNNLWWTELLVKCLLWLGLVILSLNVKTKIQLIQFAKHASTSACFILYCYILNFNNLSGAPHHWVAYEQECRLYFVNPKTTLKWH